MIFDFTPDPKVLIALTRTPMQPLDALCELVDNAIDSFSMAKIQGVHVESPIIIIDLPTKKQLANHSGTLRIQDNGPGMTAADAEKAIKAGFSGNNPYDSLGLFGMGFNISTGKLGNVTKFMTARADSDKYIETEINLEKINKTKSYSLTATEIQKGDSTFALGSHGTIIEISDWWLPGNANNGFIDKLVKYGIPTVRRELGRRYATILSEGKIRILVDGEKCDPFEHCVWDETRYVVRNGSNVHAKQYVDNVVGTSKRCSKCTAVIGSSDTICPACGGSSFRTIEERVHGWIGIQRFDSDTDYGIDLIRNGRAIRKAEKQAFFEFVDDLGNVTKDYPIDSQYGRIVGEIHLDHVPVDFMKTDFQRSSAEWQRAMAFLRGESSLQPKKPGADKNESVIFKIYQAFRRVRNFGIGDMYMGYWDPDGKRACRISRDVEQDYYQKFLEKQPGFYDDSEWWKLVESADQPPVSKLLDCPVCGMQNLQDADCCIACGAVLKGKTCANAECAKLIPLSAEICPHCGENQIPVIVEPWFCEVCHTKNIATNTVCQKCGNQRGTKDPLSKEVLLENSDKNDALSNTNFALSLADGSKSSSLSFDVYFTKNALKVPITNEELPLMIFKNIGSITFFINKSHPLFSKCNVLPEQIIASEIAMYLYDERQNLANYSGHNLSNLTWGVLKTNWLNVLEVNTDGVYEKATDLLETIRDKVAEQLGIEASYYFEDMTDDQKKAMFDTLLKHHIDMSQVGDLMTTGKYIEYVPFEFLLFIYDSTTSSFFNGGVWHTTLTSSADGIISKDIVEHVNNKIKEQYRNSLQDVINFVRDKYDDELMLRRAILSIEFLQKRLVE